MIRRLRTLAADDVREIDRAIVIGRAGDVEVLDPEVSRRHAVVRPVAEGVEIEDLGSSNGTFVDGRQITGKLTITQSATLRVGGTEMMIELGIWSCSTYLGDPFGPQEKWTYYSDFIIEKVPKGIGNMAGGITVGNPNEKPN